MLQTLSGKLKEYTLLRRSMSRWEDNIKKDLKETGWLDVYWILVAEGRKRFPVLVKVVMILWIPQGAGYFDYMSDY
jgi:hypothetical protein